MSYSEIAHITIEKTREDGTLHEYRVSLKEFNGLVSTETLPVVGEFELLDGEQKDSLFKGFSSKSVKLQIKDTGELPGKIINASYRQFQITISEEVSGEVLFDGFILPNFAEYSFFNATQTVSFTASGGIKEMQNDAVATEFKTWRELFSDAADSTGIARQIDFMTRIRAQSQGASDAIPNLLRAKESGLVDSEEANRFEAISQFCQQMNWRLVQHNGRWVVGDLYELWANPTQVRRFVDNGAGGYTISSENRLITLDDTNSIKRPSGRGEEAIGRIVLQRELSGREDWSIESINNVSLTYPPIDATPTITRTSGLALPGDRIEITLFNFRLRAKETLAGTSVSGTLNAVLITFESLEGDLLYFDYDTGEWVEQESFGSVDFDLLAGAEFNFDLSADIAPVPEEMAGTITIQARLDIDFTSGSKDDIDSLFIRNLRSNSLRLPDNELPSFYEQSVATSLAGAGKTEVVNFWHGESDERTGLQFMQRFDAPEGFAPVDFWNDEGVNEFSRLGEMIARRRAVLHIGNRSTITVLVRESVGVDMLSVIDFNDGEAVHRCLPISVKRSLLSGFTEVRMAPVPNGQFVSERGYSFTKIEDSDSKVGTLANRPSGGSTFLTGTFFNSMLNRALGFSLEIRTTAALSGSVIAISIDTPADVLDGDSITVIDGITLRRVEFVVNGDQAQTESILVQPAQITGTFAAGSYVSLDFAQVNAGILASRFAFQIFSKLNGVGVLTDDVSGIRATLPVNLYTTVREGQMFSIPLPDREEPIYVSVTRESGYTDEDEQVFPAGAQDLPIQQQVVNAPAGSALVISGVQLQSYFHVDPGRILGKVTNEQKGDAIGTLSQPRSGAISNIALHEIPADVELSAGQELRIINRKGRNETVVVAADQTLTAPTGTVNIQSKTLEHGYPANLSVVKEPSYKLTGKLNITAGRTELNQQAITDNGTAIAGIVLDVSELNTARIAIEAAVEDNEGAIAQAIIDMEAYADGEIAAARVSILADVSNDISSATAGLASEAYVDGEIGSAQTIILNQVDNDINTAVSGLASESFVNGEIASAESSIFAIVDDNYVGINVFNDTINGGLITITGDTVFENDVEIQGKLTVTVLETKMEVQGAIFIPDDANPDIKISKLRGIEFDQRSGTSYSNVRSITWGAIGGTNRAVIASFYDVSSASLQYHHFYLEGQSRMTLKAPSRITIDTFQMNIGASNIFLENTSLIATGSNNLTIDMNQSGASGELRFRLNSSNGWNISGLPTSNPGGSGNVWLDGNKLAVS